MQNPDDAHVDLTVDIHVAPTVVHGSDGRMNPTDDHGDLLGENVDLVDTLGDSTVGRADQLDAIAALLGGCADPIGGNAALVRELVELADEVEVLADARVAVHVLAVLIDEGEAVVHVLGVLIDGRAAVFVGRMELTGEHVVLAAELEGTLAGTAGRTVGNSELGVEQTGPVEFVVFVEP